MRSWGLSADTKDAETTRRRLQSRGLLRHDLTPSREGGRVIFPLIGPPPTDLPVDRLLEGEFAEAKSYPPGTYVKRVRGIPGDVLPLLPRAFDVVGDIVVIRLPREADPYLVDVGRALLEHVPRARLVAVDRGVHGPSRLRRLERIAGAGDFRTLHRENGLCLTVDLEAVYFSPRLSGEHRRLAELAGPEERWLDLFCGLGPFSLTFLKRVPLGRAAALDSNPDAIRLLLENAQALKVADRLRALEGDAAVLVPTLTNPFDRVVMNLPHEGAKFLPMVARLVRPGGWLHTYEVLDRADVPQRPTSIARVLGQAVGGVPWTPVELHVIHPYSPKADQVGMTFLRPP